MHLLQSTRQVVGKFGVSLALLADGHVVNTTGDADHADSEDGEEGAKVELRAGEALVNRTEIRLVDALVLLNVVPVC